MTAAGMPEADASGTGVVSGCYNKKMVTMRKLLLVLILLVGLAGCKSSEETIREVVVRDSIYVDRVRVDTVTKYKEKVKEVYVVDSVAMFEVNDTVFVDRFHWITERETVKDSTYVAKLDSALRVIDHLKKAEEKVTVVKEKKRGSAWDAICLIAVVVFVGFCIRIYNKTNQ